MGRERQLFIREGYNKDTQKLVIIASEGTETEIQYFEELKASDLYDNGNIFIEPLKRSGKSSSPKAVLSAIKKFKNAHKTQTNDELWVLIDRDKHSWEIKEIADVAQQCLQANIGFAMSNPCFELWLLLHITGVDIFNSTDLAEMLENKKVNKNRTWIEKKLSDLLEDGYNKSNIRAERFLSSCTIAVKRAEAMDKTPTHRWPNELGTHVYKLVNNILKRTT